MGIGVFTSLELWVGNGLVLLLERLLCDHSLSTLFKLRNASYNIIHAGKVSYFDAEEASLFHPRCRVEE